MIEQILKQFINTYIPGINVRPYKADQKDRLPLIIYHVSEGNNIETLDGVLARHYSGVIELWTKTLSEVGERLRSLPESTLITITQGEQQINGEIFIDPYITEEGEFEEASDEIIYKTRIPYELLLYA